MTQNVTHLYHTPQHLAKIKNASVSHLQLLTDAKNILPNTREGIRTPDQLRVKQPLYHWATRAEYLLRRILAQERKFAREKVCSHSNNHAFCIRFKRNPWFEIRGNFRARKRMRLKYKSRSQQITRHIAVPSCPCLSRTELWFMSPLEIRKIRATCKFMNSRLLPRSEQPHFQMFPLRTPFPK